MHVLGAVKLSGYVCGGYCSLFWVVTGTFTHPDTEQSQGSKEALSSWLTLYHGTVFLSNRYLTSQMSVLKITLWDPRL